MQKIEIVYNYRNEFAYPTQEGVNRHLYDLFGVDTVIDWRDDRTVWVYPPKNKTITVTEV